MLCSLFSSTSHIFIHHSHCYHITCNSCPDTWMKSKILSCVVTSTWQQQLYHTAYLLPLSPHTSSNCFASWQLSPHSALAKRPFSGPRPLIAIHRSTPTTLPANQWHSRQTSRSTDKKTSFQATCSRLNEWRNDQWSATLESLDPEDQLLWRMTKWVMRIPTLSPPLVTPGGITLSDSEKAETLANNLETQFQLVTDPSVPAVIGKGDVGLKSYFLSPANDSKLTSPEAFQ